MDRFQVMRLFVRIVERANFAGAARDLQVPRATVTRAIQQLEAQLGVRLLERTTRAVRPTEDGAFYYSRCVQLLADLEEVESGFRDGEPNGPLSVDLQGTLARHFVLPALPEFIARYPAITLRLSETDRMVDLIQEGIDCVLRAGALPDSSLVGRQVAASEQLTLASPDYLRRHGVPTRLEDLASHRMVAYSASSTGQPYALDFVVDGEVREIMLPYDITVRGAEIYTAAGVAGLGLIQVPRYRVERHLESGSLVAVLASNPPPRMPISILHPSSRHLSPRVRVFVDWLAELFRVLQSRGHL
jgi:DNA-binding transcriptional LysR family regulator